MTGKVLNISDLIHKDELGCRIANYWMEWNMYRQSWISEKEEVRKYVYATDTTKTSNSKLPWKNTTTIPKLCQIRDNLYSNYMASLFPKRKWLIWDASEKSANEKAKRDSIVNYMSWTITQDRFKQEMSKLILDYIDYGNAFATVDWVDERQLLNEPPVKVGYVGPVIRRISPLDIVINPTAPSVIESPKIVRSVVSLGEIKKILESQSPGEDAEAWKDLYEYLLEYRARVRNEPGADLQSVDKFLEVDGFTSYRAYLESEYCEILTFYGDIFDYESKELLSNHKIMVVDRHKIISLKPNPSYFGFPPIFHVGWRPRQDNLWAMGPLDNLVGMQYRIDHIENLKADVFDLLTFPPLKVKGYVQDFNWGPMEKIFVGDDGDVEIIAPPFQILQANIEIDNLIAKMEEMAGAPKEAMGFRTPGEKTKYEVTRLENAGARIFVMKTTQFEEQMTERLLNAMLELSRRNLSAVQEIPVFDEEYKIQVFETLTPADITGAGRLKPIAARHFAETAEMIQNVSNFYASGVGMDPEVRQHMSSIQLAKMFEHLLELQDWTIFQPYIRITEQGDAARLQNSVTEQVMMESQTPTGLTPDDSDDVSPLPIPPMEAE